MGKGAGAIKNRIKELRKEKGYTQVKLAELVGAQQSAISFIENSNRNPNIEMLLRISEVLGVTVDELIDDKKAG